MFSVSMFVAQCSSVVLTMIVHWKVNVNIESKTLIRYTTEVHWMKNVWKTSRIHYCLGSFNSSNLMDDILRHLFYIMFSDCIEEENQ